MTLEQTTRARLTPAGRQVVDVVVDRGYHPETIVARAGIPLRLVFRREDQDACTERIVFSSPPLERHLAATGPTTIDLPPQAPGEVRFTCGMGRYRGRIELVPDRAPSFVHRFRDRTSRFESPLGTALVLWSFSLPVIVLVGIVTADATATLAVAAVALIAWIAGCLWAYGHSAEPT